MKTAQPTVEASFSYYKGIGDAYIVRGIERRAIRVVFLPFPRSITSLLSSGEKMQNEIRIITKAAKYASKRGWKTIYVNPDCMDGDSVMVSNPAVFGRMYQEGFERYLCPY